MNSTNISSKKYDIGVALSGGGARGFAHAGVLRALEDRNVKPDILAGVSAGSVVAVLYASGYKPEEIVGLFKDKKFSDLTELSVPKDGFFKLDKLKRFLKGLLPVQNIEDLDIPVAICATDLDHGCTCIFRDGPIVDRVVASCSMPIVFKPVKINGINYVDGGVLRNLPAWAIRDKCNNLIGVNCSPHINHKYKSTIIDIAQRSYELMSKANTISDMKMCDTLIVTKSIANLKVFDVKDIKGIYDNGYKDACRILDGEYTIEKEILLCDDK